MRPALDHLLGRLTQGIHRRPTGFGDMRGAPAAVRQLAEVMRAVFAQWPEEDLEATVTSLATEGTQITIASAPGGIPSMSRIGTVHARAGGLDASGTEAARREACAIAAGALRLRAVRAAGWDATKAMPTWAYVIPRTHQQTLRHLGVDASEFPEHADPTTFGREWTGGLISHLVGRKGGSCSLWMDQYRINGNMRTDKRRSTGSWGIIGQSQHGDGGNSLVLYETSMPESVLVTLAGRRLDDVVLLGEGVCDTFVVHAEQMDEDVWLRLEGVGWDTLTPVPEHADTAWLDALRQE